MSLPITDLAGCKTTKIKHQYIKIELQRTMIKKINLSSVWWGGGDKLHKKSKGKNNYILPIKNYTNQNLVE